jgi:hypothetical protein
MCSRILIAAFPAAAAPTPEVAGVPVRYELPTDGPLPRTYCVTLAIVDPKNPDWIVSQFACVVARTVTPENGGRFTETWAGLDDNFMPVPPGDYGVKGIFMPARQWHVDKEWHSITPRFAGGASPWLPPPEDWRKPEPFGGDPVGAPLRDVAVGANGVAVFYYEYLENGLNCPMIDLKKPVGCDQFIRAFNSGGAAGGSCATTDGERVWAFSTDGGPKFVYRVDGKSFGKAEGANRPNSYPPEGWVRAMAVWRDAAGQPLVFVAQRGRIVAPRKHDFRESDSEFVDKITVHHGENGRVLAALSLARPQGLAVQEDALYALHTDGARFNVSRVKLPLEDPARWERVFAVPGEIRPSDLEVDSHGRFYLSDSAANRVFQLDRTGKVLRALGRLAAQEPGRYDPATFMAPGKLATWRDPDGNDRLLVVEDAGPNRVSEWSAEGEFLREFLSLQTKSNDGYAIDPEHPEHVYLPGHGGWLTRFRVDYAKHSWAIEAVWPLEENDPRGGRLDRAKLIHANGRIYLAGRRSFNVFRLEAGRCALSAAILRERQEASKPAGYAFWHDANNNGRVDDDEVRPAEMPNGLMTYHGQNWLEDCSLLAVRQGGRDVWRLAPSGFDAHGNPIFQQWQRLVSDPVFEARAAGQADAVHGGNELAENFPSDWLGADGSMSEGFYVQARGGKNFSANEGAQHKITRYVPDGAGGFRLQWRTGRTALQRLAEPGELYGAMRVVRPINGLLSVVDQSRCGILLFTEAGLYVDTLFPDGRRFSPQVAGLYPQPGEFFGGHVYANRDNGGIYIALGKYTPMLYQAEGWSLTETPVRPLAGVQQTVRILASQIASPPEMALSVRGGAGTARLARFMPALGGAVLDGSLRGWESCEPVCFGAATDQSVEVRCLYDPDHLYLRWHARLPATFEPRPLAAFERIFTHDQLADTLSFYIQGDVNAKPGGPPDGRPGDARLVFGVFKLGGETRAIAVGFYPDWRGAGKASPQTYRTTVGQAAFAHVGPVAGAQLAHTLDADGRGFVLVAAMPRSAIPALEAPFAGGFRTYVNFEATFGGHHKFWWANSDGSASRETYDEPTEARLYSGAWAPAQLAGLEGGVTVRHWLICGPFGGSGAEKFTSDPNGLMPGTNKDWKQAAREFCEAASQPFDDGKIALDAVFKDGQIRGYWPDPGEVRWKSARVADLDTRVVLGAGAQVWYGVTWLHVPAASEIEFQFQSHPQTFLRWSLNGQPVAGLVFKPGPGIRTVAVKKVALQPGWNQIMFRGYCVGYPPFRAGLVVDGPAEALWHCRLSAMPPEVAR